MRLVIISAGLEPGRDGIGDHSRALAAEFVRRGHMVGLLAVNDAHVDTERGAPQERDGLWLPTLRLPRSATWARKTTAARRWLQSFGADLIFLQFAPYSLDPRGVPFAMFVHIKRLVGTTPLFVIMHELWLGGVDLGPGKHRILGRYIQRPVISALIKRCRPVGVATSSPLYADVLRTGGIRARLIPIPSNMPEPSGDLASAEALLAAHGADREWWRAGLFGETHPGADYVGSLEATVTRCQAEGRRAALVFIGRNGRHADSVMSKLKGHFGERLKQVVLGELPPELVSDVIACMDVGIAASPRPLVGKSGAAAAFRAAGKPLIYAHEWNLPGFNRRLSLVGRRYERICYDYARPAAYVSRLEKLAGIREAVDKVSRQKTS